MPGPFYFAWVDEGTPFNPAVHNVFEQEIFSFSIEHSEGDLPALELSIKNPHIGLLAPGRKQWAYLSFDKAYPNGPADIIPLFYGRIVAVPQSLQNEDLSISFIGRPVDYQEQKAAVAETKKVRPYWVPEWFPPETRDDPDNILESRPELWHVDRVTHVVTTSNIINGEDGTLSFDETQVFYDGMDITYGETPLRSVRMTAGVDWDMDATAVYDCSSSFAFGGYNVILTFTGEGLVSGWPKSGSGLGNGWKVEVGGATRIDGQGGNIYYIDRMTSAYNPDPIVYRPPDSPPVVITHDFEYAPKFWVPYYLKGWKTQGQDPIEAVLRVVRWRVAPTMIVRYETSRKYSEVLTMELVADVQSILTDPGGEDVLELSMSTSEVATPIDPGGLLPIGDVRRRTFFAQERGALSIEYLIALMRSRLLARARTVFVTFEIPFMLGIDSELSCRKNAAFPDPRIPGSPIGGKITHYTLSLDGDSGAMVCAITIGCTIGQGGTVTAVAGDPDYAAPGYMQPGYQKMNDEFVMPIAGEVLYKSINGEQPNDDGLDLLTLNSSNVIKSLTKDNNYGAQEQAMANDPVLGPGSYGSNKDPNEIFERLKGYETKFTLVMRPVTGGPFLTTFNVELSDLKIPKTIDLEAST